MSSSLASSPRFANILLQLHSLSLSLGLSGVYRARFRISRFFSRNKGTRKNQHKRQLKEEKKRWRRKTLACGIVHMDTHFMNCIHLSFLVLLCVLFGKYIGVEHNIYKQIIKIHIERKRNRKFCGDAWRKEKMYTRNGKKKSVEIKYISEKVAKRKRTETNGTIRAEEKKIGKKRGVH